MISDREGNAPGTCVLSSERVISVVLPQQLILKVLPLSHVSPLLIIDILTSPAPSILFLTSSPSSLQSMLISSSCSYATIQTQNL